MNSIINSKLDELDELVEKYPESFPLSVVADFLNMNENGLRAALMRGNVPFGFGYQKSDEGYRVFVIPTVTFYMWFTNTNGRSALRVHSQSK